MPRVNIDTVAFTDGRFDDLAEFAHMANRHEALGRMAALWHACVLTGRDTMRASEIDRYLGAGGSEAALKADLLVKAGNVIRVKGCSGRTDAWREPQVVNVTVARQKAGKIRAENAPRVGGRFAPKGGENATNCAGESPAQAQHPPAQSPAQFKKPTSTITSTTNCAGPAQPPAQTSIHQHNPSTHQHAPAPLDLDLDLNSARTIGQKTKDAAAAAGSPRAGESRPLAADWQPQQQQQQRAASLGLNLESEVIKFRAHAKRHRREFDDVNGAFAIWLEKSVERREVAEINRKALNPSTAAPPPRRRMNPL